MALASPHHSTTQKKKPNYRKKKKKKNNAEEEENAPPQSSWNNFKNLLSCKSSTSSQVRHHPSSSSSKYAQLSAFREVAPGSTRVVEHTSVGSGGPHRGRKAAGATRPSPRGGGMPLRKLSGCYECRAVDAEPASRRYPRPRMLCPCADCGEVFTKPESLEHHQAHRHAVSELGPDDTGRNIVEIIFKSSWQRNDNRICTIERILKVHNRQRATVRFEGYRESVKSRALLPRKDPRCAADGNELLRFHCTSLSCPLGANSSTSLCLTSSSSPSPSPNCDVCTIIRSGFLRASSTSSQGIRTTASSGWAHECGPKDEGGARRAMLVCRVIAGRVRRNGKEEEEEGLFDSVVGERVVGSYGNLEDLFVINPSAILPCFVVIYRVSD